jgi:hypothetical protein
VAPLMLHVVAVQHVSSGQDIDPEQVTVHMSPLHVTSFLQA